MKRPPQLWLLSIGILCACLLPTVFGLRATSLIFAKKSQNNTSTTEVSSPGDEEVSTAATSEASADNQTVVTRPPLTGNPQIDYIWDPNLPFELNNYSLADYPFYGRVPEEIDFKCDGLHDGFYASVVHKCQVYHHCLYGTRYDFLCANFTAFDQRTFICHFASEVDCVNSKKFWHRNDALYQAASTTTVSTTTLQTVVTPSPALNPALRRPIALPGGGGDGGVGGLGRRRRPLRRRPAFEYYYDDDVEEYDDRDRVRGRDRDRDDYYDDPPPRSSGSRRRKRPRPNRRPVEYDEYDEYEDERFDRRPVRRDEDRDRRPYRDDDRRYDDRRPSTTNKNKDRKPADDEDDRKTERRPYERPRNPSRGQTIYNEDKDGERRSYDRPRKTDEDKTERRPHERPRKDDDDRRYRPKDQKSSSSVSSDDKDDRRSYDRRKPVDEDRRKPADEDRRKPPDEDRRYRPRGTTEEPKLIKPSSSSSVYDRPRAPPIIRRPVPKTESHKYDYKTTTTRPSAVKAEEDEEYYDEYEEEPKLPPPKPTRKSESRESEERRGSFVRRRPHVQITTSTRKPLEDLEEDRRIIPKRNQDRSQERGRFDKKLPIEEEEYTDEYEEDKSNLKGESSRERSERPKETEENVSRERERRPEPVIKVVKRPFLPSRGGNPFAARGLQPVGVKALDSTTEIIKPRETTENPQEQIKQQSESEEIVYYDDEEEIKPVTKRPFREPRTTQRPKALDNFRNPLDINENEYDVTLNDALNPTLPNLPVNVPVPIRNVPTGFSPGREGFLAPNYQRSRLVPVEAPVLTSANSEYVYVKQPTASARYNPYVTVQLNRQPYTTYH